MKKLKWQIYLTAPEVRYVAGQISLGLRRILCFLDYSDKSPDSEPGLDNGQTTRKVDDY